MGLDAMKIRVSIRKGLIFAIRTCYRSVLDHPFVSFILFFFIFLYSFMPSLFSFLVSSSPVLVCTAVLLGTLLSFGNPDIPEIEKEEKGTQVISSLKAGVVENDHLFVEKDDESFSVETHIGRTRDIDEKAIAEVNLGEGRETKGSKVEEDVVVTTDDGDMFGRNVVIEELKEFHIAKEVIEDEESESLNPVLFEKREFHKELVEGVSGAGGDVEDLSSVGQKKEIESLKEEINKLAGDFLGTHLDHLFNSSQDSSWKQVEDQAESSGSDSDHSESSSSDASMADIIPMLDELHPLLDTEPLQPALISLGNSDAASEQSHGSDDDTVELEEEVENQEEEQEEETQVGQEDEAKPIVTWTKDDEKNLMDLGTSELERNQRLENLIAKRRARKNLRVAAEKNLIDLDANDPPFQIAPILTTRRNPFDLPYDSNEIMGLPPIPGSAPSVLLKGRNPFDIPYDPLEEKPNLMEDSFQQEFKTFHQKDMFFRRHETFSLGASFLGELKQEKHNIMFRPYFVTERMASEGTEHLTFQRQSSDKSDSSASSAPKNELLSSSADQEYNKKLVKQELSQEDSLSSHNDCVFDHVELESHSFEVDSVEIDQNAKRDGDLSGVEIKETDEENVYEMDLSLPDSGSVVLPVEPYLSEVSMKLEVVEDNCSGSSSSSSSEVDENSYHVNADEGLGKMDPTKSDCSEASDNSKQPLLVVVDFNYRSKVIEGVDDSRFKDPVYDSSPSKIKKTVSHMTTNEEALINGDRGVLSSTFSIASDTPVEISEVGSHPVLVEKTSSLTDAESELYKGSIKKETSSGNEGPQAASLLLCTVDENESRSREVAEIIENDIKFGFSGVHQNYDYPNALMVSDLVEKDLIDLSSSLSETESEEEGLMDEEENIQLEQDLVPSSRINSEIHIGDLYPVASSYLDGLTLEDLTSSDLDEPPPSMEVSMIQPPSDNDREEPQELPILCGKSIEEVDVINNENELFVQEFKDNNSSSFSPSACVPASISSKSSENKSTTDPVDSMDDILVEIQSKNNGQVLEHLHDSGDAIGPHVKKEEFNEETEGIKEVEERLLLELDTVGDFGVEGLVLNTNQIEKQLSVEVQPSLPALQVLEARSTDDIESNSEKLINLEVNLDPPKPTESGVWPANLEVDDRFPEMMESASELDILKASSLENINVKFKQLSEGEVEKSNDLKPIYDEPIWKGTGAESGIELPSQYPHSTDIVLEFPALEARPLQDIEFTFKSLDEEVEKPILVELNNVPIQRETKVGATEFGLSDRGPSEIETDLELPVLEERSLKAIGNAFKPIGVGDLEKLNLPDSVEDKPQMVESQPVEIHSDMQEDDMWNLPKPVDSEDPIVTNLELPVLEAHSLHEIETAFQQLVEGGDLKKSILSDSVEDKPQMVESQEAVVESKDPTVTNLELPVLEAHSVKESAFKQLVENPILPDSVEDKPQMVESQEMVVESKDPTVSNLELPVSEAHSVEEIETAFEKLVEGGDLENPILPDPVEDKAQMVESQELVVEYKDPTVTSLELPVLEAHSLKDIETTFKQLVVGDLENPIFPDSVEDDLQMMESEEPVDIHSDLQEDNIGNLLKPVESKDPIVTNLELPVLEAHSLKEIETAFKQLVEGGEDLEKPILADSVVDKLSPLKSQDYDVHSDVQESNMENLPKPVESKDPIDTDLELPVLEARSLKDIDSAFRQLREGDLDKSILPESIKDKPSMVISQDTVGIHSDLQILEARSLDDIHSASTQLSEVSMENMPRKEVSEGSFEVDAKEVESAKVMKSTSDGTRETNTIVEESNRGV